MLVKISLQANILYYLFGNRGEVRWNRADDADYRDVAGDHRAAGAQMMWVAALKRNDCADCFDGDGDYGD